MSSKFVEEIGKMSVMELAGLIKELKETFNIPDMAAAAPVAAATAAAAPAEQEEKSSYTVTLKDAPGEKIKVIKALRSVTTLNLGDAKKAVENTPFVISESTTKEEAEKIKKALEESGAKVELS
ncbi:MAG: 50S ribosomal protein L7/L12 [bacterium]